MGCGSVRIPLAPSRDRPAMASAARANCDRRLGRARLYRSRETSPAEPEAAKPSLAGGDRRDDRAAARHDGRAGRARHPPRLQRPDGRRHSSRVDPPGASIRARSRGAAGRRGALHDCALPTSSASRAILVPPHPGVLSAAGLLAAPVEHEVSAAFPRALEASISRRLRSAGDLDARCDALMAQEVSPTSRRCAISPMSATSARPIISRSRSTRRSRSARRAYRDSSRRTIAFTALHRRRPPRSSICARCTASRRRRARRTAMPPTPALATEGQPRHSARRSAELVEAAVYDRAAHADRLHLHGPAIVEQADTTT